MILQAYNCFCRCKDFNLYCEVVQEIVRSFLSSAHVRYLIADGAVENLHQVSFLPSGFLALLSFRMKIYGFSYMQLLTLINQKCFDCILKKYFAFKLQIVITEYSHTPVYRLCQLAVSFNLPLTVSPDLPSPPIYLAFFRSPNTW